MTTTQANAMIQTRSGDTHRESLTLVLFIVILTFSQNRWQMLSHIAAYFGVFFAASWLCDYFDLRINQPAVCETGLLYLLVY